MTEVLYFIEQKFRINGVTSYEWSEDARVSERAVIADIASGEIETPSRILLVIPEEFSSCDVTADIAESIREYFTDGVPDRLVDFVESNTAGFVRRAA